MQIIRTERIRALLQTTRYSYTIVGILVIFIVGFIFAKYINSIAWEAGYNVAQETPIIPEVAQFPVGVDPRDETIKENPNVDTFFQDHISIRKDPTSAHVSFFGKVLGKLALHTWYQNLASLGGKILVIDSGERKEQVLHNFSKILGWNDTETETFEKYITSATPGIQEGKYSPGTYTVSREATPEEVGAIVLDRFAHEVLLRYGDDIETIIPLSDTLTIASLLEREAYDFEDMRQISGVIWNRLFAGMRLQIDATLQYAKGSKSTEPWWPKVNPGDKFIASAYNTYKNHGLPPAPIANPSVEAILAALNPTETKCLFYFHDKESEFHCTETYEEHVKLLKQYYGRGK